MSLRSKTKCWCSICDKYHSSRNEHCHEEETCYLEEFANHIVVTSCKLCEKRCRICMPDIRFGSKLSKADPIAILLAYDIHNYENCEHALKNPSEVTSDYDGVDDEEYDDQIDDETNDEGATNEKRLDEQWSTIIVNTEQEGKIITYALSMNEDKMNSLDKKVVHSMTGSDKIFC